MADKANITPAVLKWARVSARITEEAAASKVSKSVDRLKEEFLKQEEERAAGRKKGGPSYYLLQVNKNGHLFTRTVLDAFHGGSIEPTQASSLLNVHANKFSQLEAQLHR